MIVGIGCDIVENNSVEILEWTSDIDILNRFFSIKEIEVYNRTKKNKFLAGRFAAKEAVLKCLGTGIQDGLSLNEIQILQLETNQPLIELKGKVKTLSKKLGVHKWHVSITHSKEYSLAFVIAETLN